MRSLAAKLTLAFLFVGIIGALLVALLVGWQTQRQFERFIYEMYDEEVTELNRQLQRYYEQSGSWEGVNMVAIREGRRSGKHVYWRPVTLVDADGTVISGGPPYRVGQQLPAGTYRRGAPIAVGGETAGWLLLDSLESGRAPPPDTREGEFLDNVWRATIWSALGAAGLALVLGAVLARTISRPVRALTVATQAIAEGELGRQVAVRTRDELGELAASFNRMSSDLAEATRLRRQMTANIAHDLRTPLSALLGYTEALSEGKFQGSPEIFGVLHQETQHLQRLVEDLRLLSLADAGELPLHREPTPPRTLLERVALAHRAQAEAQGVQLDVEASEELPPVIMDPERMVQVLGNLVHNALRHTPTGGRVTLRATVAGDHVTLQVEDTGHGIAAEDLPHIWERLYRADQARSQDGATGLGLPIARSIVEAHGGTIKADSQPGSGATFTITLPRVVVRSQS